MTSDIVTAAEPSPTLESGMFGDEGLILAAHVSNSLNGAAAIAQERPKLFEVETARNATRIAPKDRAALDRDDGAWITKAYGAAWSLPGMLRISWYNPPGTQHGGYIRSRELQSLPPEPASRNAALRCMKLQDGTFEQLADCAVINRDGSYAIVAESLKSLDFDPKGLASVAIREKGYAYVRRDGRALLVPTFDNAPDAFIDGLVRVRIGEKLGYANRRLKLVIPAIYDGAYPFAKMRAWACIGCVSVSDGEHSWYRGGQTICLDTRGRTRPDAECGRAGWVPSQLRE